MFCSLCLAFLLLLLIWWHWLSKYRQQLTVKLELEEQIYIQKLWWFHFVCSPQPRVSQEESLSERLSRRGWPVCISFSLSLLPHSEYVWEGCFESLNWYGRPSLKVGSTIPWLWVLDFLESASWTLNMIHSFLTPDCGPDWFLKVPVLIFHQGWTVILNYDLKQTPSP